MRPKVRLPGPDTTARLAGFYAGNGLILCLSSAASAWRLRPAP